MEYYFEAEFPKNTVKIIKKVYSETVVKIWDILSERGGRANLHPNTIYRFVQESFKRFNLLYKGSIISDDLSLLDDVKKMYDDIWKDSTLSKKRDTWSMIKKVKVTKGPPSGADLEILATVASAAKTYSVEFLTFDHDFIIFADEIQNKFGFKIINAGLIPN